MTSMTQGSGVEPANPVSAAGRARRWWQRPWIAPLMMVAIVFIAFSLPPYLTFDPGKSRIRPPEGFSLYYPLLVAHVLFATMAMLMCCVQIWPWFRRRYPAAHRMMGQVYIFGGVIPAGIIGLIIGAVSPYGPTLRASNVLLATLWLIFTITGFWMVRRHRLVEHRRWMVRSFALTMSVITNRIWAAIAVVVLLPQLPTTFEGNETMMIQSIAGLSGWLGWVIPLLFAEWWLECGDSARRRANAGPQNGGSPERSPLPAESVQ
jgi:uncharacterized membrane protein YozB (DUF420 family)